jgi:hypothetical protein
VKKSEAHARGGGGGSHDVILRDEFEGSRDVLVVDEGFGELIEARFVLFRRRIGDHADAWLGLCGTGLSLGQGWRIEGEGSGEGAQGHEKGG